MCTIQKLQKNIYTGWFKISGWVFCVNVYETIRHNCMFSFLVLCFGSCYEDWK